jgi:hypothetical protein
MGSQHLSLNQDPTHPRLRLSCVSQPSWRLPRLALQNACIPDPGLPCLYQFLDIFLKGVRLPLLIKPGCFPYSMDNQW